MSNVAFQVGFDVKADPFYKEVEKLERRTGIKVQRRILRNVGTKVYVPKLRAHAQQYSKYEYKQHKRTGNLRRSFGNVTGKERRQKGDSSTIFVGPRMATGHNRSEGTHKGWVVNILENVHGPKPKSLMSSDYKGKYYRLGTEVTHKNFRRGGKGRAIGPRRKTHFREVHISLIPKAQRDIFRALKWAVEKGV